MINNTSKKQVYVKETENGTIIIRMADFYPDYVGEQEFCEVSKEFYNEFYAPMVNNESTNNDSNSNDYSVINVKIRELYPHMDCGSKTIKMTKAQYHEILMHRKKYGTLFVKTKDLYPDDKSEQEFIEISLDLYKELIKMKWKEEYEFEEKNDGLVFFKYDEIKTGEMDGIYTESCERDVHLTLMIRNLFAPYGAGLDRIAIKFIINGESPKSIAYTEHKSLPAVWKAIRKIKDIVKDVGYSYFN